MEKSMRKKYITISCPVCGREYAPSEIFIPKYFMGNIKDKVLDENGKIELFNGTDMDLSETYICDGCNNTLKIKADIKFDVSCVFECFDEEYKTQKITSLRMDEE